MTNKNAYAQSGVDVEAGYEVVERIKKHVARTERLGVMGALGGFGGMFDLTKLDVKEPVLVSGTDGVGTKLMLAIQYDKHDTIGQDCVAMCVNDIVAAGAEPLYFLDYIATGKNEPAKLEQIVAGVAEGCVQAGCGLIGGETAEMPGMYGEDDYDLAGFAVGIADKSQIIDGSKVKEGDILLGLASSGIHSNGYSLVRRVFADLDGDALLPELNGKALKDVLLEPTRIYVQQVLPLVKDELVNGIAHITGGGFIENIPRMFSDDLAAEVEEDKIPVLPIFTALETYGKIKHEEMFEIFNMGIGLVLAVSPEKVDKVRESVNEDVYEIGRIFRNEGIDVRHNPEFTSIEVYQAYADFNELMDLAEGIIKQAAIDACGTTTITYEGTEIDLSNFRRVTMNDIVLETTGKDFSKVQTLEEAQAIAQELAVPCEGKHSIGEILYEVFDEKVESTLIQPTIVTQYPTEVSPLSKRNKENPAFTDRFEMFIYGRELANAFSELNDPIDQLQRFEGQMAAKDSGDDEAHEMDEDFVNALSYGMAPTAGQGIGIDRLVMMLTNQHSIRDVLLFPAMKPVKQDFDLLLDENEEKK